MASKAYFSLQAIFVFKWDKISKRFKRLFSQLFLGPTLMNIDHFEESFCISTTIDLESQQTHFFLKIFKILQAFECSYFVSILFIFQKNRLFLLSPKGCSLSKICQIKFYF